MPEPVDELSVLREHLERYRGVTLQTLEMVPEEKLPWYPAVAQFTFAQQFLHIAQTEEFYSRGIFDSAWDPKRFDEPNGRLTRAMLRRKLEDARQFTLQKLAEVNSGQLDRVVSVPDIPVQWPLRSWLWYLIEHEIHHKAQLALYLRQIGVTPPFFAYVLPPGVRPDIR
ncbi:MAG: DinB family protein [Candidatus Acidoferrales bacterium]